MTHAELKRAINDDLHELVRERTASLNAVHKRTDAHLSELLCGALVAALDTRDHWFLGQAESIVDKLHDLEMHSRGRVLVGAVSGALAEVVT